MKLDRLVGMILILLERERVGAQELADLFEVSKRTVYRDIDAIGMAGIPVRGAPGVGGGFEIMREYKMDHKVFSAADLSAILTGLSGLPNAVRGAELASALAKVRSLIPVDRANDIEVSANQLCIDCSPWMGSRKIQPYWERIKAALQDHRLLSFAYTAHHGKQTVRTVEPYQLVLKSSQWYFQGYCHHRNAFRLFRLSRMSNLQVKAETFPPREFPKPVLDAAELLEPIQTRITVRVHKSVMDRALDFCSDEHVLPDGDAHYLVHFPFVENEYYYNLLLGFGNACECLEPPKIRAELKRRIQNMAAIYED